jgi:DNA-directed RNA polymerase subunit M/transcription elongation factor TFIIS
MIKYCPHCGSELLRRSGMDEDWVKCPKCGEIHVAYYKI